MEEQIMEKKMFDLNGPFEMIRKEKSDRLELCKNGDSIYDAIQAVLERWLTEKDERLYFGGKIKDQNHFNHYVKSCAISSLNQITKLYEKTENIDISELTETLELANRPARKRILNEDVIFSMLTERQKLVLEFILSGKKAEKGKNKPTAALEKTGLSIPTYHRVKKEIVKILREANIKTDHITSDYRSDPIACHSLDISDLRYRKINEKPEPEPEPGEVKTIPFKDGESRTLRKKSFIRITAPIVSKGTKRPDTVFWNLPCEIHTDRNSSVTIGHRRNYMAIHEAHVYARTHIPEIMANVKRRRIAMEKPDNINPVINEDYVQTFDEYRYDRRLRHR